ncbi:MAG: M16 family metallopeptidase [Putridiphycobacter sp.]
MNRQKAPEFSKVNQLDLVFPERKKLSNGIDLYWLNETSDDTVKIDIVWDAGSKFQALPLQASFTNAMLLSGTKHLKAGEISEQIDFYGGYVSHDVDKDQAGISLYGLSDQMLDIFKVFDDAFMQASFPVEEFQKLVDIRKNNYLVSQEKVSTLCRKDFNKHIFGNSSQYGKVAELEDFDKIQQKDLVDFYQSVYRESKPVIFMVGDVSDKFIDYLRNWTKQLGTKSNVIQQVDFNQTKGRVLVKKEKAIQSAIRVGKLMFTKNHPDYYKFQVLNTILGGYFGSRLMANIREDKGYTYGIGSGLSVLEDAGYFFVSTEVAKEVTDQTIQEIFKEMNLLQTTVVSAEELDKVKNYMLGELLRHADGPIANMENFKNIYYNNLSEDYYSDYVKAINDVTAEQLQTIAQKYWQEASMLTVISGDI